jgi:hypothetical protein
MLTEWGEEMDKSLVRARVRQRGFKQYVVETASQPLRMFEVIKSFDVESGTIAPWYGQPGLGIQFRSPMQLIEFREGGFVRELTQ